MKLVEKSDYKIGNLSVNIVSDARYAEHLGFEFEPETCSLITHLASGDVAMDVGANIGMTSILMAAIYKRVHSFEPAPSTFSILSRNILNNKLENVVLHHVGLGDAEKSAEITFAEGNRSGGFVSDKTSASKGHIIEAIKILPGDKLRIRPSFVKIDVEGYELHALRGLRETISVSKPIVMFEANHWCLNAFQRTSFPDFVDEALSLFPLLYAVHGHAYLDLTKPSDRYKVLYLNILRNQFQNFVGGFDASQFARFHGHYTLGA